MADDAKQKRAAADIAMRAFDCMGDEIILAGKPA